MDPLQLLDEIVMLMVCGYRQRTTDGGRSLLHGSCAQLAARLGDRQLHGWATDMLHCARSEAARQLAAVTEQDDLAVQQHLDEFCGLTISRLACA